MAVSLARLIETGRALELSETAPPAPIRATDADDARTTDRPAPVRQLAAEARTVVPLRGDGPPTAVPVRARDLGPVGTTADRRHERVAYHLPVTVYGPTSFCAGVVEDLSESGAFVRTQWPFPVDSAVEFVLDLTEGGLAVHAVVRWRRLTSGQTGAPAGMGVQFVGLAPDGQEALRRFVRTEHPSR